MLNQLKDKLFNKKSDEKMWKDGVSENKETIKQEDKEKQSNEKKEEKVWLLSKVKGFVKQKKGSANAKELRKESDLEKLEQALTHKFTQGSYKQIAQKMFKPLLGVKRPIRAIAHSLINSSESDGLVWSIRKQSFIDYENEVISIQLALNHKDDDKLWMNTYLKTNEWLKEDHDVMEELFKYTQSDEEVITKDQVRKEIENIIEWLIADLDIPEKAKEEEKKKYLKKYDNFFEACFLLTSYPLHDVAYSKKNQFFAITDENTGTYLFTNTKITLDKLRWMASNRAIKNFGSYKEIIILDDEIFDKFKKNIWYYKAKQIKELKQIRIPQLKSFLFTSLLSQEELEKEFCWPDSDLNEYKIEDFQIAIFSDDKLIEEPLIMAKVNDSFRHITAGKASTHITKQDLISDIETLGGNISKYADTSLTVGWTIFRCALVNNQDVLSMTIRQTDWDPFTLNQLAEGVVLTRDSIKKDLINPELISYTIDQNLIKNKRSGELLESEKKEYKKQQQRYEKKAKKLKNKGKWFFLEPYKIKLRHWREKWELKRNDYTLKYGAPYSQEVERNFFDELNSWVDDSNWFVFVGWTMSTWKSTAIQALVNKLLKRRIEIAGQWISFAEVGNPIEKNNAYCFQYRVDDRDKDGSRELIKSFKRQNIEAALFSEIRWDSSFASISDLAKSALVMTSLHVDSIWSLLEALPNNYIEDWQSYSDVFNRLRFLIIHKRVENIDPEHALTTKNKKEIKQKIEKLGQDYLRGHSPDPEERKNREKIIKDIEKLLIKNYELRDQPLSLGANAKHKKSWLVVEWARKSTLQRYVANIKDIENDVEPQKIYDYMNAKDTMFYQFLIKVLKGEVTLDSIKEQLSNYDFNVIFRAIEHADEWIENNKKETPETPKKNKNVF